MNGIIARQKRGGSVRIGKPDAEAEPQEAICRRSDGSIDTAFYHQRALDLRSQAWRRLLGRLLVLPWRGRCR